MQSWKRTFLANLGQVASGHQGEVPRHASTLHRAAIARGKHVIIRVGKQENMEAKSRLPFLIIGHSENDVLAQRRVEDL
jgi:hypothetical protein